MKEGRAREKEPVSVSEKQFRVLDIPLRSDTSMQMSYSRGERAGGQKFCLYSPLCIQRAIVNCNSSIDRIVVLVDLVEC